MRYVQGNQPNVPAPTMCRHGLYNSVRAHTSLYILGQNYIELTQTPHLRTASFKQDLREREKKINESLHPALLEMYFQIRLCPQHISNQTEPMIPLIF